MFCDKCGKEAVSGANFCAACGNPLVEKGRKIPFSRAIKVNAWLVIIGGFFSILLIIISLSGKVPELRLTWNEMVINIVGFISFVLIWIMYFQRKYTQHILKVFYIEYFFEILLIVPFIEITDKEALVINILILIIMSLLVVWLAVSKEVKLFMQHFDSTPKES